jgi:hypothetical protein
MTKRLQLMVWAGLRTLLDEVRRSPIFLRSLDRNSFCFRQQWASVRKTQKADEFVLAWLASQRTDARRLMS